MIRKIIKGINNRNVINRMRIVRVIKNMVRHGKARVVISVVSKTNMELSINRNKIIARQEHRQSGAIGARSKEINIKITRNDYIIKLLG